MFRQPHQIYTTPPVRSRLRRLLTDFIDAILHERAYAVHDREETGPTRSGEIGGQYLSPATKKQR